MVNKNFVERELDSFAEVCEIVEQEDGIVVKSKKGAEAQFHKMFQELYRKVIEMGGEYKLGRMQFFFPTLKPPVESVAARERMLQIIHLEDLVPPSFTIRLGPGDAEINEMAESFKTNGVLEPLVVRLLGNGKFGVVAGARRLKAAEKIGIETLPCVVMDLNDQEMMELQFAENEDRKDLSDYERGRWLKEVMLRYPETYPNQTVLGDKIGKGQPYVSQMISHYEHIEKQKKVLPSEIITRVIKLPEAITREIQQAPEELKPKVTKAVVEQGLSSRETKKLVQDITVPNVTQEEALKTLQEDTQKRIEAEEKRQEALIKKMKQYYPAELVDYVAKRDGVTTEGSMLKAFYDVVLEMWRKLSELGLINQILKKNEACQEEG